MACEFFDDGRLARCTAVQGLTIPSHHEREKYCRTDGNVSCPTFQLYQLRRGPVTQDAYYALWMPSPPTQRASEAPEVPLVAAV
ncbi:MAG TPA: hypothetical protein VN947_18615 [Polyangia bacterium]|nr:hypothetical protein [Polyangia bacterium]